MLGGETLRTLKFFFFALRVLFSISKTCPGRWREKEARKEKKQSVLRFCLLSRREIVEGMEYFFFLLAKIFPQPGPGGRGTTKFGQCLKLLSLLCLAIHSLNIAESASI